MALVAKETNEVVDNIAHRSLRTIASHFVCPITQCLIVEPAILMGDACMYEKAAIEEWITRSVTCGGKPTSPATGASLAHGMISTECTVIRCAITDLVESGVLDDDTCIAWHVARGKISHDDSCAMQHFQRAAALGCTKSPRLLEVQSRGIELRRQVLEFMQDVDADDADWANNWAKCVLNMELDVQSDGHCTDIDISVDTVTPVEGFRPGHIGRRNRALRGTPSGI